MSPYVLVIPLPDHIRTRLATFCFGLPQVHWVEKENFHLTLRYLGPLSDTQLAEIKEKLASLFFTPFSIILQGFGQDQVKKGKGTIWIGIADQNKLLMLKKEINNQLRALHLPTAEHSYPHITLGHYDHLSPQKLADYFVANSDYQSDPFEVTQCILMRIQQTPKRVIYQTIEEYQASQPLNDVD